MVGTWAGAQHPQDMGPHGVSAPWGHGRGRGDAVLGPPGALLEVHVTPAVPPPAGFSIEGPSQAKIECDDKGDGSCDVRYWPTEPGDYAVHVVCDDEDIKDSPFIAHILPAPPDSWPEKVPWCPAAPYSAPQHPAVPHCAPLQPSLPLSCSHRLVAPAVPWHRLCGHPLHPWVLLPIFAAPHPRVLLSLPSVISPPPPSPRVLEVPPPP